MMHSTSAEYKTALAVYKAQSARSSEKADSEKGECTAVQLLGCEVNRCNFPHLP